MNPWPTCQRKLGKQIVSARAIPPQNQRLRKYRRACESTSPPRTPAMKKTIEYFVSRPKPTTAPMPSHQRGFSVLSKRIVNQAISTHHRKSKDVYWNSVPLNSGSGESATAIRSEERRVGKESRS